MDLPHRITTAALDAWARAHDVGAVYLFGSAARGTARAASDVDVALWLARRIDPLTAERLREEAVAPLSAALGVPEERLDVRVLNDAPLAFQFRVIRPRRWLWEADHAARIDFEVRTLNEYYDYQHFEDIYRNTMRRKLEEGAYGHRSAAH